MSKVRAKIKEAQSRLRAIGVPTDPDRRWTRIDRRKPLDPQIQARTDETAHYLYNVITAGRKALAARAAGDWDAYTDALETMVGQEISSRLPTIRTTIKRQYQRQLAKKKRNSAEDRARALFDQHQPKSAKAFGTLCREAEIVRADKTITNWFSQFNKKKNSR